MHSQDITMGDLAYSQAQGTTAEIRALSREVEELRQTVNRIIEHNNELADAINHIAEKLGLNE